MSYTHDFEIQGSPRELAATRERLTTLQKTYSFQWSERPWPGAVSGATFYLAGESDEIMKVRNELKIPGDREIDFD